MYSTVPPWLRQLPSLIGTVTGTPGGPFPTRGSEVVSHKAGARSLLTNRLLSGHLTICACLHHSLFHMGNLTHIGKNVNPQFYRLDCGKAQKWRRIQRRTIVLRAKWREKGSHNTGKPCVCEGNIIRRIMLTNVTKSTIYCVKMTRNTRYTVMQLT